MKNSLKEPCKECPFKRDSIKGWLGDSSPEEFMAMTMADTPMPCHMTIDYDDPDWEINLDAAEYCQGALIFFANIYKMSRSGTRPKADADRENVFGWPEEFLKHHNDF